MSGELKFYYDNGNWIRRDIAVEVIVNTPSEVQNYPAESAQFGSALRQNEIIDAINSLPAVSVGTGDLIRREDAIPNTCLMALCAKVTYSTSPILSRGASTASA